MHLVVTSIHLNASWVWVLTVSVIVFMFTLGTCREPGIVVLGWVFFGCWELGAEVSFEARFSMFFSKFAGLSNLCLAKYYLSHPISRSLHYLFGFYPG